MPNATPIKAITLAAIFALFASIAGCQKAPKTAAAGPPAYEGKYKNAQGSVVLELKEGRAIFTNPHTGAKSDTTVQPNGNDLGVESSAGTFTMKFEPPDTITGMPASIAGDAGPLKKVQ